MQSLERVPAMVCAPIEVSMGVRSKSTSELLLANGYSRILVQGEVKRIQEVATAKGWSV